MPPTADLNPTAILEPPFQKRTVREGEELPNDAPSPKRLKTEDPVPNMAETTAPPEEEPETPKTTQAPARKTGSSSKKRKSVEPPPLTPEEETRATALAEELLETVDPSWKDMLKSIFVGPEGLRTLTKYEKACSKTARVFPPRPLIMNAFTFTKFEDTRVVILGQDPYHREGQAMGLAFSVPKGVGLPPSLKKIYEEIGIKGHTQGDLTSWCEQGVLLLNPVLTVEEGKPNSHQSVGWHIITDAVLERLSSTHPHSLVFMLWGNKAQAKAKFIDDKKHLVLTAAHPSPLATKGGFIGCRHFERANEHLQSNGLPAIDWRSLLIGTEEPTVAEPEPQIAEVPPAPIVEEAPAIVNAPSEVAVPPSVGAVSDQGHHQCHRPQPSPAMTDMPAPTLITDPMLLGGQGGSHERLSELSDKTEGEE